MKAQFRMAALLIPMVGACSADPADREAVERGLQERFDELGRKIDDLRERSADAGQAARDRARELIADLEVRRAEAGRRLRAAREASRESWGRFKDDASSALDQLGDAVGKAWNELKK